MGGRFLIVRLGSLGDVIHGIPVAAALRAHDRDARIDWLVDPRYVELLDLVPVLDGRIGVDPRRSVASLLQTIGRLRSVKYDAVIDLQGLIKSAVLARAAGGARTIGFARGHLREAAAGWFYSRAIDPGSARHVVFKNLALLRGVGIEGADVEFPLRIVDSPAAREVADRFGADGYALLNPAAAWPNKRWPPDRFAAVAAAMRDELGIRSLALWGPGEQALASAVVAASRGAAELSPSTRITDLFAIAKRARLIVSGDTGPLHIAAAVGTPVVSLFGPTQPERNGPWSAADIAISRVHTCSCLYERRCRRAEPCIDDISVAEVVSAVRRRVGVHG